MKRDAVNSTKMKKFCIVLDLPIYSAAGILELLWHLTGREAPQGDIGKLSNEDISLSIDWRGDPDVLIDALVLCRWLDRDDQHRLLIHDWSEHSDDSVDVKLARSGRCYADGRQPRMNRLSVKERERLCAAFGWKTNLCAQKATKSYVVVLPAPAPAPEPEPEPEPLPIPEPEPGKKPARPAQGGIPYGANGSESPKVLNRARGDPPAPAVGFSSTKDEATNISRAVMEETGLSSNFVFDALKAQATVELKKAKFPPDKHPPDEIRQGMVLAWNEYQRCIKAGKVKIDRSAEKFFGEGRWKDSALWGLLKKEKAWS